MVRKGCDTGNQRQTDALYVFDILLNLKTPLMINVNEIANGLGVKPNTVIKRLHTIRDRYSGFNIKPTVKPTNAPGGVSAVTGSSDLASAPAPASVPAAAVRVTRKSVANKQLEQKSINKRSARTAKVDAFEVDASENEDQSDDSNEQQDHELNGRTQQVEAEKSEAVVLKKRKLSPDDGPFEDKQDTTGTEVGLKISVNEVADDGAGDHENLRQAKRQKTADVTEENMEDSTDTADTPSQISEEDGETTIASTACTEYSRDAPTTPDHTFCFEHATPTKIKEENASLNPNLKAIPGSTWPSWKLTPDTPCPIRENDPILTDASPLEQKPKSLPQPVQRVLFPKPTLTFDGVPLKVSPYSEATKQMIASGQLKNGVTRIETDERGYMVSKRRYEWMES